MLKENWLSVKRIGMRLNMRNRGVLSMLVITVSIFLSLIIAYALAAAVLGWMPVNRSFAEPADGVDIYIRTDPVHTDLLLPLEDDTHHWRSALALPGAELAPYLALDWGDRAFYLETPTWADLRAGNAFRALFGFDASVMHVSSEATPRESANVIRVRISREQLRQLVGYVDASFARDAQGRVVQVSSVRYGKNDAFYEAVGNYSMFSTCNQWVRNGLSAVGIRTAAWAPFAWAINYQARRIRGQRRPE